MTFPLFLSLSYAFAVSFHTIAIIVIILVAYSRAHSNVRLSERRAFQLFVLGISSVSFILAAINFLTYPNVIFSSDSRWILKGGPDWIIGSIPLSQILYFVAKDLMVYLHRFILCFPRSFFDNFLQKSRTPNE